VGCRETRILLSRVPNPQLDSLKKKIEKTAGSGADVSSPQENSQLRANLFVCTLGSGVAKYCESQGCSRNRIQVFPNTVGNAATNDATTKSFNQQNHDATTNAEEYYRPT
jgi:hypothetical protein